MRVLLDTSVAVAMREGDEATLGQAARVTSIALLSILSVIELEGGVPLAVEGAHVRRLALDELYGTLQILEFGQAEAGQYRTIVSALGFSRSKIIDRMIAAQAIVAAATLVTLNPRDFHNIPDLTTDDWST